ncbi:MAG: beta-glucosidase [Psychromonas sp.]|jgi:beta-glucosidase|uniref:glycoside hydrolase family 3 protein n=1 Tax=Psychromonas sp. TaxID=1884585 RepID=UPI0039E2ECD7
MQTTMQTESISIAQKNLVPVSRQAAAEGIVMLENKNATLPLKQGEKISLFGRCQIDTYRSGTGSGGAVNVPYAVNALQGLRDNPAIEINEQLVTIYEQWITDHPFDDAGGGWAAEPWFQQEMPLADEIIKQAAADSKKALFFIGRTAGEDQDNADAAGSYRLTDVEVLMIEKVNAHFDNVIIVLNVTNIMDMSWLESIKNKQSIQAVLYSWAAGMEGGHALADVLCGAISPSGRLSDTIAYQLSDYPSSANFGRKDYNLYAEDIYLGYRYFETFNPEAVQYEFGAGLSYTQFSRELIAHSVLGTGINQVLQFEIKVQNIGSKYSSKEVIQVYVEAPQGQLGKPTRVLAGFVKSRTLKPGENEILRVCIALKTLASYDDSGVTGHQNCYVLEQGCYQFYVGASVRHAQCISATFELEQSLVTEELSEALAPIKAFERLKPGVRKENGLYQATYEAVPQRSISLAERIQANMPTSFAITGDQGLRLIDVKEGRVSLTDFVAQMNPQQLATIIRSEGMCSPKVTPGSAAAFGGLSDSLFNLGIPVVAAADGPSGIRMDSGHKATQVPIGTLLACTWNSELNEQLFYLIGQELYANQIDTLLGPAVNIHRHPLNGRNFEYFSEDALMTGTMAAAQTRGLKKAGVSGTLKHFAGNDQETARTYADSVMSQRALREIHIKPFEMAVKEGLASTIMTSYNPVNGHWTASNYDLNTTILRGEWGFTGIVMTDWWAKMNDPITAGKEDKTFTSFMIRSQNDLYMVVENDGAQGNIMGDDTLKALENGTLTVGELQRSAMNICRFIIEAPVMGRPLKAYEPIKVFKANNDILAVNAQPIENSIKLNCQTNSSVTIEVAESGTYQCSGLIRYDRNSQAQSSCSLWVNGIFSMSFSVNGSDGKLVTIEGLQVKLEKGRYKLDLDFVKPGLKFESIIFTKA